MSTPLKQPQLDILNTQNGYDGFFKIDILQFRHSLYKGGWSVEIERELFNRGEAVVVLLYDLATETIVLVEQCRAGALGHAESNPQLAWLLEPVAGMIDEGETELQACQRETQEEAGVSPSAFEFICRFYPSPGGSSEILHLYAAEIDSTQLPEYAGLEAEGEDIRIVKLPFADAKQQLLNASFNVASTIIGVQWLLFQKLPEIEKK